MDELDLFIHILELLELFLAIEEFIILLCKIGVGFVLKILPIRYKQVHLLNLLANGLLAFLGRIEFFVAQKLL